MEERASNDVTTCSAATSRTDDFHLPAHIGLTPPARSDVDSRRMKRADILKALKMKVLAADALIQKYKDLKQRHEKLYSLYSYQEKQLADVEQVNRDQAKKIDSLDAELGRRDAGRRGMDMLIMQFEGRLDIAERARTKAVEKQKETEEESGKQKRQLADKSKQIEKLQRKIESLKSVSRLRKRTKKGSVANSDDFFDGTPLTPPLDSPVLRDSPPSRVARESTSTEDDQNSSDFEDVPPPPPPPSAEVESSPLLLPLRGAGKRASSRQRQQSAAASTPRLMPSSSSSSRRRTVSPPRGFTDAFAEQLLPDSTATTVHHPLPPSPLSMPDVFAQGGCSGSRPPPCAASSTGARTAAAAVTGRFEGLRSTLRSAGPDPPSVCGRSGETKTTGETSRGDSGGGNFSKEAFSRGDCNKEDIGRGKSSKGDSSRGEFVVPNTVSLSPMPVLLSGIPPPPVLERPVTRSRSKQQQKPAHQSAGDASTVKKKRRKCAGSKKDFGGSVLENNLLDSSKAVSFETDSVGSVNIASHPNNPARSPERPAYCGDSSRNGSLSQTSQQDHISTSDSLSPVAANGGVNGVDLVSKNNDSGDVASFFESGVMLSQCASNSPGDGQRGVVTKSAFHDLFLSDDDDSDDDASDFNVSYDSHWDGPSHAAERGPGETDQLGPSRASQPTPPQSLSMPDFTSSAHGPIAVADVVEKSTVSTPAPLTFGAVSNPPDHLRADDLSSADRSSSWPDAQLGSGGGGKVGVAPCGPSLLEPVAEGSLGELPSLLGAPPAPVSPAGLTGSGPVLPSATGTATGPLLDNVLPRVMAMISDPVLQFCPLEPICDPPTASAVHTSASPGKGQIPEFSSESTKTPKLLRGKKKRCLPSTAASTNSAWLESCPDKSRQKSPGKGQIPEFSSESTKTPKLLRGKKKRCLPSTAASTNSAWLESCPDKSRQKSSRSSGMVALQQSGKERDSSSPPLFTGKERDSSSPPLLTGKERDSSSPLLTGKEKESSSPPLLIGKERESSSPLLTGKERDSSSPPLFTGKERDSSSPPLFTGKERDSSSPPLFTGKKRDSSSPPLFTGKERDSSSPPLLTGKERESSSPLLTGKEKESFSPLLTGKERDSSSPPLFTGKERESSSPPLFTGKERDSSSPPLFTGKERESSSPLLTGKEKESSSPPLFTGKEKESSSPPLLPGKERESSSPPLLPESANDDIMLAGLADTTTVASSNLGSRGGPVPSQSVTSEHRTSEQVPSIGSEEASCGRIGGETEKVGISRAEDVAAADLPISGSQMHVQLEDGEVVDDCDSDEGDPVITELCSSSSVAGVSYCDPDTRCPSLDSEDRCTGVVEGESSLLGTSPEFDEEGETGGDWNDGCGRLPGSSSCVPSAVEGTGKDCGGGSHGDTPQSQPPPVSVSVCERADRDCTLAVEEEEGEIDDDDDDSLVVSEHLLGVEKWSTPASDSPLLGVLPPPPPALQGLGLAHSGGGNTGTAGPGSPSAVVSGNGRKRPCRPNSNQPTAPAPQPKQAKVSSTQHVTDPAPAVVPIPWLDALVERGPAPRKKGPKRNRAGKEKEGNFVKNCLYQLVRRQVGVQTVLRSMGNFLNVQHRSSVVSGFRKFLTTYQPSWSSLQEILKVRLDVLSAKSVKRKDSLPLSAQEDPRSSLFQPCLLPFEAALLWLTVQLSSYRQFAPQSSSSGHLLVDVKEMLYELIKESTGNFHLSCALIRLYACCCRLLRGALEHVQLLCCELMSWEGVVERRDQLLPLLQAVAMVWPAALIKEDDCAQMLKNKVYSPSLLEKNLLTHVPEVVVAHVLWKNRPEEFKNMVFKSLFLMCGWRQLTMGTLQQVALGLVQILQTSSGVCLSRPPAPPPPEGARGPRALTPPHQLNPLGDRVVSLLALCCRVLGWAWANDCLIRSQLWPLLQAWSRRDPQQHVREVTVLGVCKLIGQISYLGAGFEGSVAGAPSPTQHLTNLLVSLVRKSKDNKDVTLPIQLAVVNSLLTLRALNTSASSTVQEVLSSWLQQQTKAQTLPEDLVCSYSSAIGAGCVPTTGSCSTGSMEQFRESIY